MEHLLTLLLLSTISALVGFGFNRMQDDDMIFTWYREWLEYLDGNQFATLRARIFVFKANWNWNTNSKFWRFNLSKYLRKCPIPPIKRSKFLHYITKPLGLCIFCNTAWIGIISTLILTTIWTWMVLFNCIIVASASIGIVTLIINKFNQLQREEK